MEKKGLLIVSLIGFLAIPTLYGMQRSSDGSGSEAEKKVAFSKTVEVIGSDQEEVSSDKEDSAEQEESSGSYYSGEEEDQEKSHDSDAYDSSDAEKEIEDAQDIIDAVISEEDANPVVNDMMENLKDVIESIEIIQNHMKLRSNPRRDASITIEFGALVTKLVIVARDMQKIVAYCKKAGIELKCTEAFTEFFQIISKLEKISKKRALSLMTVGPLLSTTAQLLGVVNTTLLANLSMLNGFNDQPEVRTWNRRLLAYSTGLTVAVVGTIYVGNYYQWWAVIPPFGFIETASNFLKSLFGY